ncbi:ABC transporter ATP-binding protein [Actinomadura sp. SCN-SB]|uniref:ABC transporter ATP-binding protein n=1 Tax=Actinomadura sp. SCN-SB TaxID=3373092 RepID=UPI0037503A68
MLETEGITVTFGGLRVVDDVGLSVERGELIGLAGPNGSGKTSFLNALCGIVPAQGRVSVDGTPVRLGRPRSAHRAGIGRVFQAPQVYGELSCIDNVLLSSSDPALRGLTGAWPARPLMFRRERRRWDRAMEALELVGLAELAAEDASLLSYGQQRLLELARALAGDSKLLLLDEPSAGLNDAETTALATLLGEVRAAGNTLVLVDHKIDFLDALCDRLAVLELGRIIAFGRPDEVWRDDRVVSAYLGVPADAAD